MNQRLLQIFLLLGMFTLFGFSLFGLYNNKPANSSNLPCLKEKIHKNKIGKVAQVRVEETIPLSPTYHFEYVYPDRYKGTGYTKFDSMAVVKVGDLYLWVPANHDVRNLWPDEDRYVPIVADNQCRYIYQVDWSMPSAMIP